MSLSELRSAVRTLPRRDEGVSALEYPVRSPYEAHDAVATFLQLLEHEITGAT